MSRAFARAHAAGATSTATVCALLTIGCVQSYQPPALPNDQLALVTLDSSASVLDVDGLPPPTREGGEKRMAFYVGTGCRSLTAKYEASYFIWGERKARKAGHGSGLAAVLANTEVHDYETMKPIQFFIPAKAGRRYWVTATFTGDEFLPRVVEIEPSGDAVRKFQPDQPCKATQPASETRAGQGS